MSDPRNEAVEFAHLNKERYLNELKEYVSIPSISTDPEHHADMQKAADWTAAKLTEIGMDNVEILENSPFPVVYGEYLGAGEDKPTMIIYGHYDVQPADPLELWETGPFEPTMRGDNLYGRGTADMKGQVVAAMAAAEAVHKHGGLPVNIKWLIEGAEEIGSPGLDKFLEKHKEKYACDMALNVDGAILGPETPSLIYFLRGLAYFEINVTGPDHDLHSGLYGGTVVNPANELARLIAGMHDENGRITLPGFYDKVIELDQEERDELAKLSMDEDYFLKHTGAPKLWGEKNYTPVEHAGSRPTLDVNGFVSGFTGEGSKTVLPSKAMAKISTRLVSNQLPEDVHQQLEQYFEENANPGITWEITYIVGNPASLTPRDSDGVKALSKGMESVWGVKPLFQRMGGSVPVVYQMEQVLGIQSVNTGFGLPDDNLHSPNEKLTLGPWYKGIDALIHFFHNLGE